MFPFEVRERRSARTTLGPDASTYACPNTVTRMGAQVKFQLRRWQQAIPIRANPFQLRRIGGPTAPGPPPVQIQAPARAWVAGAVRPPISSSLRAVK